VESLQDTLRFSFIGYRTEEIPINGRTNIDVTLESEAIIGEDIVVVGYGTQRREEITSSISSVNSDDFTDASATDAADLIRGKIPGLIVSNTSGDPRSGTEISLRGTTTLEASSDPLVLVDGVPGNLNTVAPENIKSIDVLKDGSAAAIYGSRGSNGVILITTDKYSGQDGTSISYDGYVNYQTIARKPDPLNADEYRQHLGEGSGMNDYGYSTDWMDEVLRNPVSHTHNLNISGGDTRTNYSASLNYLNNQGIFLRTESEEVVGRVNVSHSMFEGDLVADVNMISKLGDSFSGFDNETWLHTISRNPTDRIRNDEGNWQERVRSFYSNPLGLIHETDGREKERDLRIYGTVTWSPIQNLSLKVLGSSSNISQLNGYSESHNHVSTAKTGLNGYASRSSSLRTDQLLEFTGNYQQSIDQHNFSVLGGYSYQEVVNEGFSGNNQDFPNDIYSYYDLEMGDGINIGRAGLSGYFEDYKLIGIFSRMNYDWDNRLILMGSVRYEGNSKFGSDHKWGIFPALSLGWRISEESFLEDIDFISDLKVRAGFGVTGIAPTAPYQSLTSYQYSDRVFINGNFEQTLVPARNANPDLRWERKEEINIGLDFSLINNRLSGSLDLYQRDTKDMLWNYDVPVPPYLYDSILANVGQIRNEGIEASILYEFIQQQDINWTASMNYSTNKNKLVTLSNETFETTNDYFDAGDTGSPIQLPTHRVQIGGPIGNFYGYESVDIDENGEWIVLDENGDRVLISQTNEGDRRYIGNGIPDHYLSLNNQFRYENFDLNINIRGAFGHQILNKQRLFYENPSADEGNFLNSAFDPVYGKQVLDYDLSYTSFYIEDGDYIKIDDVTLGYTFDVSTLNLISNARLYVSGRNLFTFTGYSGIDPEVSSSGIDPGIDPRAKYPTTRTFTLGVNLAF
jgi:TonB-linked SusC/RagA family outer membrane protein